MKYSFYKIGISLLIVIIHSGCEKFLDAVPDKKLVIPSTLQEAQALLDNTTIITANDALMLGEASCDNFYLRQQDYDQIASNPYNQRLYSWGQNIFPPFPNHWSGIYDKVYYANTILSVLPNIPKTDMNAELWDDIKGQALYLRGKALFESVSLWSLAFDEGTADTDLGIPLRIDPDFNIPSVRASVRESYAQVEADLLEAADLLKKIPQIYTHSSQAAAYSMLARMYLSMRKYSKAALYADSALQQRSTLMNFNVSDPTNINPNPSSTGSTIVNRFNPEVYMHNTSGGLTMMSTARARVDTNLYNSYTTKDKRRTLFFKPNTGTAANTYFFRGSYTALSASLFSNTAVDEMFLIRAECAARAGNKDSALNDLNRLLYKRMDATFTGVTAPDAATALDTILAERRKELVHRGLRWLDIKRLNKEGRNITLRRIVNGQPISLSPNHPRFALPLPEDIIAITGMPQNPY